ncbi:MAG TPA: hypothetical protein VK797_30105 [Tepidisphaeraceae bacterium]|nr:hypothetical protein [Tepidisphaeraceae bacterium]
MGLVGREIVSRVAMLFMAALCVAGGLGLIHAGNVMYPYEPNAAHRYPHNPDPLSHTDAHGQTSTSHYLYAGGFALSASARRSWVVWSRCRESVEIRSITMSPLRYAVLRHSDVDEPHFDLMFETLPGSMLATWRSAQWPIEFPTQLTRLRDHRRLYLEFEGDIPGNRGSVIRVAEGTCEVQVVGDNSVWRIHLLTGSPPATLVLRQIADGHWEATPAM